MAKGCSLPLLKYPKLVETYLFEFCSLTDFFEINASIISAINLKKKTQTFSDHSMIFDRILINCRKLEK